MTAFKDKKNRLPKRYTIRFTLVRVFILATLITATIAISLQFHFSKKMAVESTRQIFTLTSDKTKEGFTSFDRNAEQITQLLATLGNFIDGDKLNDKAYSVFAESLKNNNEFYSIYVGFPNGNFYQLINLNANIDANNDIRQPMKALPRDRWLKLSINKSSGEKRSTYQYLDNRLNIRTARQESSDYTVTSRPWYVQAQHGSVHKTPPYLFKHLQTPGQTYSVKIPNSDIVLAVDITLSSFGKYLSDQEKVSIDGLQKEVYLYQKSGEIIATNQQVESRHTIQNIPKLSLSKEQQALVANTATLKVSNELDWAPIDFSVAGKPMGYSIDMLSMVSAMTGLSFEYTNGLSWPDLVTAFEQKKIDILQPIYINEENNKKGLYTQSFIDLPFSIITLPSAKVVNHIEELNGKTLAIPEGWSVIPLIQQHYPKINIKEYPSSKDVLKAVSSGESFAGLDSQLIFEYTQKQFFIDNIKHNTDIELGKASLSTSLHFMLHKAQQPVLDMINLALSNISQEARLALSDKWFNDFSANNDNSKFNKVVPYQALISQASNEGSYGKLTEFSQNGENYLLYLTPVTEGSNEFVAIVVNRNTVFLNSLEKVKISIAITAIILLLTLPISWAFSSPIVRPIKLLALENEKIKNRQYKDVKRIYSNIKEIDALGVSLVEMSMAIDDHVKKQQELMDSFIKLIGQTIDDKSPYTGGHCNRVPELGLMLVNAAIEDETHFKDFSFKSNDEMREFKISSWLHDCGKIITPEHIVDKGSKLEAIYNRIHEIRMRFEVLWLAAEVEYYQAVIKQPEQQEPLHLELTTKQQQLQDDFTFVAEANVGSEFLSPEKIERLTQISTITWQRQFDDKLGLSPAEETHLAGHNINLTNKPSLPITENLLSNKLEHIFTRRGKIAFDDKFGIKVNVPEYESNLGELYNLSISRGTLTEEDRYKINEHIIGTIKMLDQLPFPPELSNVPKYASTHHETLIGTGYPRKLTADDLTIPERILVIADIFEALTAADRPYKKAKTLSVSINILHKFALDQHIDIDLFELFLTSGTYKVYAEKYLHSEQIDHVDINKYIRA